MKQPVPPTPGQFKALVRWLYLRFGVNLIGRVNFTRGFWVGETQVTPEIMQALVDSVKLKKAPAPKKRNPRNKHPSNEDVSVEESSQTV